MISLHLLEKETQNKSVYRPGGFIPSLYLACPWFVLFILIFTGLFVPGLSKVYRQFSPGFPCVCPSFGWFIPFCPWFVSWRNDLWPMSGFSCFVVVFFSSLFLVYSEYVPSEFSPDLSQVYLRFVPGSSFVLFWFMP